MTRSPEETRPESHAWKVVLVVYLLFLFSGVYEQSKLLPQIPDPTVVFGVLLVGLLLCYVFLYWDGTVVLSSLQVWGISLFVLLAAWWSLSLLWAPETDYGRLKVVRFVVGGTLAFVVPVVVVGADETRRRALVRLTILFGTFVAVVALSTRGAPLNVPAHQVSSRPVGLAVVGATVLGVNGTLRRRTLSGAVLVVGILALAEIGARAPFATAVVTISVFGPAVVLSSRRNAVKTSLVPGLFAAVTGVYATVFLLLHSGTTLARRFESLLYGRDASLLLRLEWWRSSIAEWTATPFTFLFGRGAGAFAAMDVRSYSESLVYPHNIPVETALEVGLLGLLLFVGTIVVCGFALTTVPVDSLSSTTWIALAWCVFAFANALISGDVYSNKYLYTSLGLLLGMSGRASDDGANSGGDVAADG